MERPVTLPQLNWILFNVVLFIFLFYFFQVIGLGGCVTKYALRGGKDYSGD